MDNGHNWTKREPAVPLFLAVNSKETHNVNKCCAYNSSGNESQSCFSFQVLSTFFCPSFFFKHKLGLELTKVLLLKADEAAAF